MKKFMVLFAAITIHICLGSVYAWSIFVPALRQEFGYSALQTQLIFGCCFLTFTISMVFVGKLHGTISSRLLGMTSAILFLFSYVIASFFADNFVILLLSMGLLCGISVSFGYISALVTVSKLFSDRCGLMCGLVVAGYGLGAILLSFIAEKLFARGLNIEQIFLRVGPLYGIIIFICSNFLVAPQQFGSSLKRVCVKRIIKARPFWAMATGMFCGSFAGLLIIGNLKSISLEFGFTSALAAFSVTFMAIGNSGGRVFWGAVFDRHGEKSIVAMLTMITISILLIWIMKANFLFYGLAVAFMASSYSGCFSVYPAQVGMVYGTESIAKIYPLIMLFHGLAALIAASLGGLSFDLSGSYVPGLFLAIVVMLAGVVGHSILSKPPKVLLPDISDKSAN
jgi:MFS transporter, OFA family, oxalate/formate antiporter